MNRRTTCHPIGGLILSIPTSEQARRVQEVVDLLEGLLGHAEIVDIVGYVYGETDTPPELTPFYGGGRVMAATAFQLEQAEQFRRLLGNRTEPLTYMQALTAIDHIEALTGVPVADHLADLAANHHAAPIYWCDGHKAGQ